MLQSVADWGRAAGRASQACMSAGACMLAAGHLWCCQPDSWVPRQASAHVPQAHLGWQVPALECPGPQAPPDHSASPLPACQVQQCPLQGWGLPRQTPCPGVPTTSCQSGRPAPVRGPAWLCSVHSRSQGVYAACWLDSRQSFCVSLGRPDGGQRLVHKCAHVPNETTRVQLCMHLLAFSGPGGPPIAELLTLAARDW